MLPDLRYSAPAVFDRFQEIVLGGALANNGMPSFKQTLSEAELAAIRVYVLSRRALIAK
jgi:alcohol dehydrogenase (cytochrome c)/quinohemoprotein ethanol dehydrogenase